MARSRQKLLRHLCQRFPELLHAAWPQYWPRPQFGGRLARATGRLMHRLPRAVPRRRLKLIDVKPEIQQQFFERIQEQLKPTVWQSGGCRSWYQDRVGHNVAIWPGLTVNYRWLT